MRWCYRRWCYRRWCYRRSNRNRNRSRSRNSRTRARNRNRQFPMLNQMKHLICPNRLVVFICLLCCSLLCTLNHLIYNVTNKAVHQLHQNRMRIIKINLALITLDLTDILRNEMRIFNDNVTAQRSTVLFGSPN